MPPERGGTSTNGRSTRSKQLNLNNWPSSRLHGTPLYYTKSDWFNCSSWRIAEYACHF